MFKAQTREIVIKTFCDTHTIIQAIKIAVVVGTILNIINQGDYIFHMQFEHINYFKMGLTFFVPFCVSTYTAVTMNMKQKIGSKAIISTNLTCKRCKTTLHVKQDSIIPECPNCGLLGQWKISK